jgi:amphi-Trp domain-containing protein
MRAETLFEYEQTLDRADVAAYLREMADRLDADGQLELAAGGPSTTVSVPARVEMEVEVERRPRNDGSDKMELEIELSWREGGDGAASGPLEIG